MELEQLQTDVFGCWATYCTGKGQFFQAIFPFYFCKKFCPPWWIYFLFFECLLGKEFYRANSQPSSLPSPPLACDAGVFWGRANAIAAILDFKRRGRLGRVERATKGEGISLKGKGGGREGEEKNFSFRSRPIPAPLPSSLRFWKSNMAATINRDFGTRASSRKRPAPSQSTKRKQSVP